MLEDMGDISKIRLGDIEPRSKLGERLSTDATVRRWFGISIGRDGLCAACASG